MNIGMLWFDNDPKTELSAKIERAAVYYRNKYGKTPTLCFVHPSMLPTPLASPVEKPAQNSSSNGSSNGHAQETLKAGGVEVRSNTSMLPHHFWIGVNGNSGA